MTNDDFGYIPLLDAVDLEILMHKDAHFSKQFPIMIEYYEQDGIGVMPEFDLERIKELKAIETSLQNSLSDTLLPDAAKQQVERSKKLYLDLKSAYDSSDHLIAQAVANLILSEEEYPENEIAALVEFQSVAVDPMIHLISSNDYYDPLFPGYGRSPIFAAKVLEQIQDRKAIPYLFAAIGQENFFTDDAIIQSLLSFGEEAKSFLIKRLLQEPISKENLHAIMALTTLEDDEEVAQCALRLMEKKEVLSNENFMRYLIFSCSGLRHETDRLRFLEQHDHAFPSHLKKESAVIIKNWM